MPKMSIQKAISTILTKLTELEKRIVLIEKGDQSDDLMVELDIILDEPEVVTTELSEPTDDADPDNPVPPHLRKPGEETT